jgi:hypothetical protein
MVCQTIPNLLSQSDEAKLGPNQCFLNALGCHGGQMMEDKGFLARPFSAINAS